MTLCDIIAKGVKVATFRCFNIYHYDNENFIGLVEKLYPFVCPKLEVEGLGYGTPLHCENWQFTSKNDYCLDTFVHTLITRLKEL